MAMLLLYKKKIKNWDFLVQKFFFLRTYATLNPPLPLVSNRKHLDWLIPSPFVRTHYVGDPFTPKQKYSSICEQEDLLQQF